MESCDYPNGINNDIMTDAIKLAEKMLRMAEKGIHTCENDSCLLLCGVIRDCGYKIRRTVEQEQVCGLQKGDYPKVLH